VAADTLTTLTSAVAPVVMVSAAGILLTGVQGLNLHLADRIRGMTAELRLVDTADARRAQIREQIPLLYQRIRLTQWALTMLYAAIFCFMMTSLFLVSSLWIGLRVLPPVTTLMFAAGVAVFVVALVFELLEVVHALRTIQIETRDV
jgi:hypothetical protein